MFNQNIKEGFLATFSNAKFRNLFVQTFEICSQIEEVYNKDISELEIGDYDAILSSEKLTLGDKKCIMFCIEEYSKYCVENKIFKQRKQIDFSEIDVNKIDTESNITKNFFKDLDDLIDYLECAYNGRDKNEMCMIISMFGIPLAFGTSRENLVKIKKEDLCIEDETLNINGEIFDVPSRLLEYLSMAVKVTNFKNERGTFEYTNSPYLLRVKKKKKLLSDSSENDSIIFEILAQKLMQIETLMSSYNGTKKYWYNKRPKVLCLRRNYEYNIICKKYRSNVDYQCFMKEFGLSILASKKRVQEYKAWLNYFYPEFSKEVL